MHTKFRVTYMFMAWQKKSLGGIKYNSTALALHNILELYNTEGSITMYFPFFHFFSFYLWHWPFLGYSTFLPASLFWNRMMVLCDLKILDTLQAKYSVMSCYEGRKITLSEKKYLQWQANSPEEPGLLHWIFSKFLWKCWWAMVNGRDFSSGRTDAPKESACGACSANMPASGLCLLALGLTSSEPLGRREIWSCLSHLTLHTDDLPSSGASWC